LGVTVVITVGRRLSLWNLHPFTLLLGTDITVLRAVGLTLAQVGKALQIHGRRSISPSPDYPLLAIRDNRLVDVHTDT